MLGEHEAPPVFGQPLAQLASEVELLFQPLRHALQERAEAGRSEGDVGREQPVELQDGLVVEADVVDLGRRKARLRQAVVDGARRKAGVVFDAAEPLFLGRSHDLAIDD
jgi:hypothetical protein